MNVCLVHVLMGTVRTLLTATSATVIAGLMEPTAKTVSIMYALFPTFTKVMLCYDGNIFFSFFEFEITRQ